MTNPLDGVDTSNAPYVIVSSDTHAGLQVEEYRPYLESQYHPQFDEWVVERHEHRRLVEEVNGLVTYDGGKVPSASSGDDVLVRFVEIDTREEQSISTDDDDYTIQLPSGIYDVQVQLGASDPRPNSLTTVGLCVEVP